MTGWDRFDVFFCINLPERTERWAEAQRQFRGAGLGDRVVRVDGIRDENPGLHINRGSAGHTLALLKCLKAARALEVEHAVIFEDDIQFYDVDIEKTIDAAWSELPRHWLTLQFHSWFNTRFPPVMRRQSEHLLEMRHNCFSTTAVVYNKKAIHALISVLEFSYMIGRPADITIMKEFHERRFSYLSDPMLCYQSDGYSDNWEREVTYVHE